MSIWFTITAVGSLLAIAFLCGLLAGVAGGEVEDDPGDWFMIFSLVALLLWLVFLIWLWIGLIRTAWKWGNERLGTPIFKYLQIGFFVATTFVTFFTLFKSDLREHLEIFLFSLMVFDIVIVVMILNFLSIAWFARCKIPLRAYWEICSIIVMVILQVWLFT